MVSVEFSESALKELEEIDSAISKRIVEKVFWFQQNFDSLSTERLHYGLREMKKLRVGDYRVVYFLNGNILTIKAIRHRREVYR